MKKIRILAIIRLILISILIIFINYCLADAQEEIEATARLDKNVILIGDHIKVDLELRTSKNVDVIWHRLTDSIGQLEILQMSPIDTLDTNKLRIYKQRLIITSFDSGYYYIPPVVFGYKISGDTSIYPVETNALKVTCKPIGIDTTKGIKDIKGPLEEPVTIDEYIIYIIIGVAIIVAAFIFNYFWKRRKLKYVGDLSYDPRIPPHIIALEALKQLESEKLWQKGLVKLYYIRLTEVIRTYIERRFNIPALEMTTPDIISNINLLDIDFDIITRLKAMLELGDLVKFAKVVPLPDENSASLKAGYDFVYKTIPVEKREEVTDSEH